MDIETETTGGWMRGLWTLPPYKGAAFMRWLSDAGWSIEEFRAMPAYAAAVEAGLIVDDKWTGRMATADGWQKDMPFEAQTNAIIQQHREILERSVEEVGRDAARPLLDDELGETLAFALADPASVLVDSEDLSMVGTATVPGASEAEDHILLWASGLRFVSEWFIAQLTERKLPRFYVRPGRPGAYLRDTNAIMIPSETDDACEFMRAVTEYLLTFGTAQRASTYVRNSLVYSAPLLRLVGGGYALAGPWLDIKDGQIAYKRSDLLDEMVANGVAVTADIAHTQFARHHGGGEFVLGAAARLVPGREADVAKTWVRVPDQLALLHAVLQGRFVERG